MPKLIPCLNLWMRVYLEAVPTGTILHASLFDSPPVEIFAGATVPGNRLPGLTVPGD